MKVVSFMSVNSGSLARKPFDATGIPRDELTAYSMHVMKLNLKATGILRVKKKAKIELRKEL